MTRSGTAWLMWALLAFGNGVPASETPEPLPLWPEGAAGAAAGGEQTVRITDQGERVISNVHRPSLTPYLLKKSA
jgi:hypothetical protein